MEPLSKLLANADYEFGYDLGRRYGLIPALLMIVAVSLGPFYLARSFRDAWHRSRTDRAKREREESDRRSVRADGPPRFNG